MRRARLYAILIIYFKIILSQKNILGDAYFLKKPTFRCLQFPPDKFLSVGVHPVKMVVRGDHSYCDLVSVSVVVGLKQKPTSPSVPGCGTAGDGMRRIQHRRLVYGLHVGLGQRSEGPRRRRRRRSPLARPRLSHPLRYRSTRHAATPSLRLARSTQFPPRSPLLHRLPPFHRPSSVRLFML